MSKLGFAPASSEDLQESETISFWLLKPNMIALWNEGDFPTDPKHEYFVTRNVWQIRIILEIEPVTMNFSIGIDADEIQFVSPSTFASSEHEAERRVYEYAKPILNV